MPRGIDQNVRAFQISMDDAVLVKESRGDEDIPQLEIVNGVGE